LTQKQVSELDQHRWNRISTGFASFREFCFTYFPQYFYAEPSIMHEDLFKELQEAIDNGTPDALAYAAPRGNAKSTIVSFALVIWCAVYRKKHYIIIVSDTADQANDFLANIKSEFEDNELLRNDFGDLKGLIWTSSDLILKGEEVRIQALGAGKKVRGRRYKQWRPDLIIGDDLENDENVQSPDQRKKMEVWHNKALAKAGDERTDKIIIGTILHFDSLLSKLLKNPIYKTRIYKSIMQWSNSPLWEEWTRIVTNLENPNRLEEALAFYQQHKDVMLEGTKVLWNQKEPYYALMLQYIADGPAAFSSEKQNEPLAMEDRWFHPDWIKYYDDEEIAGKELYVVGFCDPSLGKNGGDYSAIITVATDMNYQIYVLDADIARRHPDIIGKEMLYKSRKYEYKDFGVEINQFQELFSDDVKKLMDELGITMPLRGVRQHTDKILRIQSLQPDIKNGRVKFRRDQKQLIDQLTNFPSDAHDDGPDALEGAIKLLGKRSAVADYYKSQAYELTQPTPNSFLQNPSLQNLTQLVSR